MVRTRLPARLFVQRARGSRSCSQIRAGGAGTPQDMVKAYAHYRVAQQLGRQEAAAELQKLDGYLQPAAKSAATQLAESISASLKPTPLAIVLESPEAEAAGASPWAAPSAQPAAAGSAP